MPGISWVHTKDYDLRPLFKEFHPRFVAAREKGKRCVKNPFILAVCNEVSAEIERLHPGLKSKFELPIHGSGGTPEQRESSIVNRIKERFENQRDSATGAGRKQDVLNLSDAAKTARKSQEAVTYGQLFKDKVNPIIRRTYAAHVASCGTLEEPKPPVIYLNWHKAECARLLATEDQTVKAQVREANDKKNTGLADAKERKWNWEDQDTATEEELLRRETAWTRQSNLDLLWRTINRLEDQIHQQTGWNVLLLAGGPMPKEGGRPLVYSLSKGVTVGDELDFESYWPGFQGLLEKYGEFVGECSTREERAALSLELRPTNGKPHEKVPARNVYGREDSEIAETVLKKPADPVTATSGAGRKTASTPSTPFPFQVKKNPAVDIPQRSLSPDSQHLNFIEDSTSHCIDPTDNGFGLARHSGGRMVRYEIPHPDRGRPLSYMQTAENQKALNEALLEAMGLKDVAQDLAAQIAIEDSLAARKVGDEDSDHEEGADPTLEENKRVTRSRGKMVEGVDGSFTAQLPQDMNNGASTGTSSAGLENTLTVDDNEDLAVDPPTAIFSDLTTPPTPPIPTAIPSPPPKRKGMKAAATAEAEGTGAGTRRTSSRKVAAHSSSSTPAATASVAAGKRKPTWFYVDEEGNQVEGSEPESGDCGVRKGKKSRKA